MDSHDEARTHKLALVDPLPRVGMSGPPARGGPVTGSMVSGLAAGGDRR
jgi:hypothetical protein